MTVTTTDAARRKARWGRGRLRALAWTTGIASFLAGIGVLGAAPMPEGSPLPRDGWVPRQRVVVRKITRRVVVIEPAVSAPVTYVQAPSVSSSSSGTVAAPPPAPPPTGGS
jgi:hypothetical protein